MRTAHLRSGPADYPGMTVYFCAGDSAFAPFLARAVPDLYFLAKTRDLAVTKTSKGGPFALSKAGGR
jgi:hypothetical protein